MAKRTHDLAKGFDRELADFPPELRWREWMARVEAVIFASNDPVGRDALARVIGAGCNLDLLIDDIREELRARPYDLVAVAGGWSLRTRPSLADAIRVSNAGLPPAMQFSELEKAVLAAIAFHQPVTRGQLSNMFGREISRDTLASLRNYQMIAAGPRSPQPGAPFTYITTKNFLSHFNLNTLGDLPSPQEFEDAGFLSKDTPLSRGRDAFGAILGEPEEEADEHEHEEYETEHS